MEQEQTERKYDVKPQDFIPFIGSFVYQHRNWKESEGNPKPYLKYLTTGLGLTALNITTGMTILNGLETLLK